MNIQQPESTGIDRPNKMTTSNDASASSPTGTSLEDAVSSLSRLFSERQQNLDQREKELAERRAALEREKRDFGVGNYSSSDVIPLNVSGHITATLRRTLTTLEGSMLASRFSGRWDDSLEKDREGNFFIDQPFELFNPLLNYLRAKQSFTPLTQEVKSPTWIDLNSEHALPDFKRMVEYYGMTPAVFPTRISVHNGTDPVAIASDGPPVMKINAEEWGMFELKPHGHSRSIVSYEITIDVVESFQVGWIVGSQCSSTCQNPSEGLGAHESSMVLDFTRGGTIDHSKAFTKVDDARIRQGSVVRCIASSTKGGSCIIVDGVQIDLVGTISSRRVAAFSGKGTWSITKVDLEI